MGTTKSTAITNLDASPSNVPTNITDHGRIMSKVATTETASGDSASHQHRFFRMNAQDRIIRLNFYCDATAGLTDSNIGLYAINGGDAIDDNCYLDAADYHTGLADTTGPINYKIHTLGIENIAKRVWEDASVATDPGNVQYDLTMTNVGDVSAAGTLVMIVEYVAGS
jgi:hypothetical protein